MLQKTQKVKITALKFISFNKNMKITNLQKKKKNISIKRPLLWQHQFPDITICQTKLFSAKFEIKTQLLATSGLTLKKKKF